MTSLHDSRIFIKYSIYYYFPKGVVPNAQRAAVVAGVELAVYDWCKKKILDNDLMADNVYTHFL